MTRRKLRQELDDVLTERDAYSKSLAEMIIRLHESETVNALLMKALSHSLSGRNDDAWAIVTELGGHQ